MSDNLHPSFHYDAASRTMICQGDWTVHFVTGLHKQLRELEKQKLEVSKVTVNEVSHFDSAGALILNELMQFFLKAGQQVKLSGLKVHYAALYQLVNKGLKAVEAAEVPPKPNVFHALGVWAVAKLIMVIDFISFIGEVVVMFFKTLLHPYQISIKEFLGVIQETGHRALGIIALMSFLIGIVLAYQLSVQLKQYGANIFVVDVTGIAILREFAPLITAVIMAGRTSTAFAALIGTMKVNEEIDALRTMGVGPVQRLVLPRIIALIVTLPLLTVWSDIFGIFGSMVMARSVLDVSFHAFLQRFDYVIQVKQYWLGLIKTPVFALVIAGVGCFQGFSVGSSADSVGKQTTKAAVQSIFLIIIVDALFSVIYSFLNL